MVLSPHEMDSLQWAGYRIACDQVQLAVVAFRHRDGQDARTAQKSYNGAATEMSSTSQAAAVQQQGVTLTLATGRAEDTRAAAQVLAVCRRSHAL